MIGLDFFQKIYPPESKLAIFDVGAHHGDSVSEFITLFPMSRVFAFEPDKTNWSQLSHRFANEPRVEVSSLAVGQNDGRALLHRNNYDATHSLLPFNAQEINRWGDANDFHQVEVVEVDQTTLDTFCSKNGLSNIDILKLDTQGGEMMAFLGAKAKLSTQSISCIFCEVEFRQLYERQPLFWDISVYLMSYSYHFLNMVSPKVTDMGVLSWADAIYVNDQLWQKIAAKHSAGKLLNKSETLKQDWEKATGLSLNVRLDWMVRGDGSKIDLSDTTTFVVTPPKAWSYGAVALIIFSEQPSSQHGIVRILVSVKEASAGLGFTQRTNGDFIKRVEVPPINEPQEIFFDFDDLSELRNLVIQTWDKDKSAKVELLEFSVRDIPRSEHLVKRN